MLFKKKILNNDYRSRQFQEESDFFRRIRDRPEGFFNTVIL